MAHDVFISYSAKDKVFADAAVASLEERGMQCWLAPRNIPAGAEWGESIVRAIQESKVMVLVLSANSNESRQVRHEVERADHYHVPILPVRIEDFQLTGNMEYHLPASQWLDATQAPFEQHLPHLADSVQYLLKQGPAHKTRIPL